MTTTTTTQRTSFNTAAATLWAAAFVIVALIIVQAGRLPANTAHAGNAAESGGFTLLTAASGRGGETGKAEVLYVIDDRREMILVYEIENVQTGRIVWRDGGSLDTLFRAAR